MKILVVDDDAELRGLLGFTLTQAGFEVCAAADGSSALAEFSERLPDLVLLDMNIPAPDGLKVCREIRKRYSVPIMMLTVRDQEDDLVAAFDAGADDYVQKPFRPRTLLARIRALSRRVEPENVSALDVGELRLDLEQHTLQWQDLVAVRLTPLELKVMQLLMMGAGRTVATDRLLAHVWGCSTSVVGFCYGGGIANFLATRIPDLAASVPFYGGQPKAEDVAKTKSPLLIHYAGADDRVNAGWPAYEEALKSAGVKYQAFIYPGVQHGFNNDTTPRYDEAAAKLAWQRTVDFFKEKLRA